MHVKAIFAAVTIAAAAVVSTGATAADNPALQQLIAAAKAEGATVTMRDTVWADVRMRRATEQGIKQKYGIDFKMDLQAGSLNEVAARLVQEHQAGHKASVDLAVGEVNAIAQMIGPEGAGILAAVDWKKYDPNIPDEAITRGGQAIQFTSRIATFAYNTTLIKKPPTTIDGLFTPEAKGHLAATPYAAVWDNATMFTDPAILTAAVNRLVKERYVTGLVLCGPDLARVGSGEFAGLAMSCGDGPVEQLAAKGAPIANAYIDGLSYEAYEYLAMPKHSARPNSATLFMLFALSPEGQKIMRDFRYQDLALIPGNLLHKTVQKLKSEGRNLPLVTLDLQLKNKQSVAQYKAAFIKEFAGLK